MKALYILFKYLYLLLIPPKFKINEIVIVLDTEKEEKGIIKNIEIKYFGIYPERFYKVKIPKKPIRMVIESGLKRNKIGEVQ
jgi:hypothetical protein